jgi:hypothetical protein
MDTGESLVLRVWGAVHACMMYCFCTAARLTTAEQTVVLQDSLRSVGGHHHEDACFMYSSQCLLAQYERCLSDPRWLHV